MQSLDCLLSAELRCWKEIENGQNGSWPWEVSTLAERKYKPHGITQKTLCSNAFFSGLADPNLHNFTWGNVLYKWNLPCRVPKLYIDHFLTEVFPQSFIISLVFWTNVAEHKLTFSLEPSIFPGITISQSEKCGLDDSTVE